MGRSSPRRHEDTTCIHKEVTEVTEAGDGGLRIMRLAGQPAGRGIGEDVGIHKEVAEVTAYG
jgi:hypothetical protein